MTEEQTDRQKFFTELQEEIYKDFDKSLDDRIRKSLKEFEKLSETGRFPIRFPRGTLESVMKQEPYLSFRDYLKKAATQEAGHYIGSMFQDEIKRILTELEYLVRWDQPFLLFDKKYAGLMKRIGLISYVSKDPKSKQDIYQITEKGKKLYQSFSGGENGKKA